MQTQLWNWEDALICSSGRHLNQVCSGEAVQHYGHAQLYPLFRENFAGENRNSVAIFHRMMGAERSFVTVGRSFTVAKGFSPLWRKKKNVCRNSTRWEFDFKRVKNYHLCSVKFCSSQIPDSICWLRQFLAGLSTLPVTELCRVCAL